MKTLIAGAAVVLALACASQPMPVPATIDPQGAVLLTGEWSGTYDSPAKDRSGFISFQLEQDADSTVCRGDVLMIPRNTGIPVRPVAGHFPHNDQPVRAPRMLVIESIRVMGDKISGRMEPYEDPGTFRPVRTAFEGRVVGDTIRGTLTSLDEETGARFTGTWSVTRKMQAK